MKLFFDGRFIKPDHPDGISRFSLGLISALKSKIDLTVMVSSDAQEAKIGEGVSFVRFCEVTSPKELLSALKLNRLGASAVFSPMQTTSGLGKRFKLILTLHDLIYYRHKTPPKEFSPIIRLLWFIYHLSYWPQRIVLNGADAVATVSKTTKNQIERVRLTKRPVEVIYNASDLTPAVASNGFRSNQVLYMGSFIGYKNVETLIRAIALTELELVLLSKITPQRKSELSSLADAHGATVRFIGGVSDAEYSQWLTKSRALVSASYDEGFGIPVVEAMSHGIPVVLSDLAIFKEVAGAAGLFFDANDEHSLAAHLQALGNQPLWDAKSAQAINQSKNFSWQNSADALLSLVRSLGT